MGAIMKYFKLNILGNNNDKSLALITKSIVDIGLYSYCMAEGKRVGDKYPKEAQIYLQPEKPGKKLSSFIGNTKSYFIVNSEMKDVIIETCKELDSPIEMLPFTLYDHKKRVISKDYWIINPVGTFDCLDRKSSEIKYMDDDPQSEIVGVKKFVFNPKKLENAPDLFRVPEDPTEYFISERLVKKFQEKKFTNLFLTEIEVSET
jgi:hypothetical protein